MVGELQDIAYFDIETSTFQEGVVDPKKDTLRFFGLRRPNGSKIIFEYPAQKQMIQNVLSNYKYIAGHNINKRKHNGMDMGYDIEVMKRHGFKFKTRDGQDIITLDTQEISEKRLKSMMYLDFSMSQMSLKYLTEYFNLVDDSNSKGEFDYNLYRKPFLTPKERKDSDEYLKRDLESGWLLFKFYYEFFEGFKQFMKPSDVINMSWLTRSAGTVAYKSICNASGLPEKYADTIDYSIPKYEGGYVALPYRDYAEGNIYCIDFASLYPHMYMGGNLYSPIDGTESECYSMLNAGIYGETIDAIQGSYKKEMGKIEKTIQGLYTRRVDAKDKMKKLDKTSDEYKRLDKLQLAIKIIINTMYGISGSQLFVSVYNRVTASDCTAMARRSIKHARQRLSEQGYECLYTDTDSVYVLDHFKNEKRLLDVTESITMEQIASFNITIDTHNFEIEDKIQRMYFFKRDDGTYNKKHYIYVLEDGRIKAKGGRIVKGDCSPLAKEVYKQHIIPKIQKGEKIIMSPETIMQWTIQVAKDNHDMITKRFRVKPMGEYKSTNGKEPTSIQYQVSKMYGTGEHHLVCNKYFGAGKGVKYCTIDEIKGLYGVEWLSAVDYTKYVNDLKHFIEPSDRKMIKKL